MQDDPLLHASHAGIKVGFKSLQMFLNWVQVFNTEGLIGLEDKPKSGQPPTHDQKVHSELTNLALQKLNSL